MSNLIEVWNLSYFLVQNIFTMLKNFFTMPMLPFTIIFISGCISKRKFS